MTPTEGRTATANRRASRRQPTRGTTRTRAYRNALGLGPNIAVSILDLSETGVRMLLKEALPAGQEFELSIDNSSTTALKAIARVIWCVPAADGTFCVGANFTKPLPYRDLMTLARP